MRRLLTLFLILWGVTVSPFLQAEKLKDEKKNVEKGGKKQAFMGDPAQKRGFEIGYDLGVKAGKSDKKNSKKSSPTTHEDFKNSEKKFRYEYGSHAKFIAAYQAGFQKGYKLGFEKGKEEKKEGLTAEKGSEKTKREIGKNAEESKGLMAKEEKDPSLKQKAKIETSKPTRLFNPKEDAL